ncbi:MAG TPA: bacillithiol biosynthesis cysteine-adding enzyme BshC [Vicinamibacterales bacterium]|nr:bacillithiol biosynthesis cysteine-adding enzyme BshC [Vicinamibacterales bacterium]
MPVEPKAADQSHQISAPPTGREGPARLDVRQAPWMRPLAGDYAFNYGHVAPFYAGDPASPEAWTRAIARAQQHAANRAAIARILQAQQATRSAPSAALDATRTLAADGTVAVVTGQQAGVFGGPLFTLLKAITALQLARRVSEKHGTRAVAVFWVDAEDHDWAEIASSTVLDVNLQPRTITVPPPDGAGELPVASLTLDERIEQSLAALAAALTPTDFTPWVVDRLRAAFRPGMGVADAFARWLEDLLGPHGLIVFDSSDPAAKPLAAAIFSRELASAGRSASLAAAAGDALLARGHTPQVTPQRDSVSVFHLDGGRHPIKQRENGFLIDDRPVPAAELYALAASHPDQFSPNVLLRPVVQDALFPTVAYVAGPSELAYLGQLGTIYEHFGVPMPLMYPRATATLVESGTARFLAKYKLPFQDLQAQDESALNRLLAAQLPQAIEDAMREAGTAIERSLQRLIEAMPALDPTLAGAARTTMGKMEHELRALHAKMISAAKKRDETLRRQFIRAQTQAFPHGEPQERALATVFFLNRYGPALVQRLLDELPLELGYHWIVTI